MKAKVSVRVIYGLAMLGLASLLLIWGFRRPARSGLPVPQISAGDGHAVALLAGGRLYDGTSEYRNRPTRVGNESDWTAIAAGGGFTGGHSVALNRLPVPPACWIPRGRSVEHFSCGLIELAPKGGRRPYGQVPPVRSASRRLLPGHS